MSNSTTEFKSYLAALVWSSVDMDRQKYLDNMPREFDHDTKIQLREEFERFYVQAIDLLGTYDYEPGALGHDFWLSRNGHGAGFFEEEWFPHCDALTELASSFGVCYPYVDAFNNISI